LQARIHINATSTMEEAAEKNARNQRCRILIQRRKSVLRLSIICYEV